jgi:small-conductance mechanosensitive channel
MAAFYTLTRISGKRSPVGARPVLISMEFLDQTTLGNTHRAWLLALATAVLVVVLVRTLQSLVRRRLGKVAARTATQWDDHVIELISRTRLLFWIFLGVLVGSMTLDLSARAHKIIVTIFVIALLIQGGIWGMALIKAVMANYRNNAGEDRAGELTTLNLIGFIAQVAVWSLVVLLVLDNLGIDITALVAGLGIGGIAVALAVQNILGDLFASLSIVLDKPFVIGDFLIIGDLMGSVEHVGLKTTRVRSLSGEQLIFSNADLLKSRIRNYGRMYERRVVFRIGVTYETPRAKLKGIPGIIRDIIEGRDKARFDRSHFMEYADYSLNFETVYYVLSPDYNVYMDIQQDIYFQLHERLEQEEIEFAYPTQKLFLAGSGDRTEAEPPA